MKMGDTKNSNNSVSSYKNGGKKNGNVDKTKMGGKNESTKNRSDTNSNSSSNKNLKNKTGRKSVNNGVTSKNSGTKSPKQEVQTETMRSANNNNNNRGNRSRMVDSTTQTSTPLRLHLDGMFHDTAGGYQRPSLNSVESECTEDEEDDELVSELGAPSSPLSSHRSSARASFSNKELGYGYNFKFEWAQSLKTQQILVPTELKPRCFQDLENSHEHKLLRLTDQLNELMTTTQDNQ